MADIRELEITAYRVAKAHYDSYRGWVGRNSWWLLATIAVVFYIAGYASHT